jgi:uncharacterized damage-inducible protein DinB
MHVLQFAAVNIREFLISPIAYLAPEKTLDGLSTADAERRLPAVAHSVAEIVAHLSFWQDWFYARCAGHAQPMVSSALAGWPAVDAGTWPDVRSRFVNRLSELGRLADGDVSRALSPPIEFPPLAAYTTSDALIHVATHNAHHLGQVIVLRQLLGVWPPPAGSWTW